MRKESRNHSNGLAEAAAKALQPPVWRLDRMEPISLSVSAGLHERFASLDFTSSSLTCARCRAARDRSPGDGSCSECCTHCREVWLHCTPYLFLTNSTELRLGSLANRKKLLAFAQVHTHAASRVGPLRSSASLPKYVHGGGKWVVGSSTRYKPASSSSQRSQSPWDYK